MIVKEALTALIAARNLKNILSNTKNFYDKFRIVEANVGKESLSQYNRSEK
jgi:hypothetical protein